MIRLLQVKFGACVEINKEKERGLFGFVWVKISISREQVERKTRWWSARHVQSVKQKDKQRHVKAHKYHRNHRNREKKIERERERNSKYTKFTLEQMIGLESARKVKNKSNHHKQSNQKAQNIRMSDFKKAN